MKSLILRVKLEGYDCWSYVNSQIILPKTSIDDKEMPLEWFLLDKKEADQLCMNIISRKKEINIKQLAIAEVVNIKPYPEMNVVFYREFDG